MTYSVDRAGIIGALQEDEMRSYRSIADEFGVSDWTVRSIARQLNNDPRPMKRSRHAPDLNVEQESGGGWIVAAIIAAMIGAIWFGVRYMPPPEGGDVA
jgi:hypothetical protein